MKYNLRDYFYDRLSAGEEENVQKYLCDIKDADKAEEQLRELFDECLKSPGQHKRQRGSRAVVWTCALSAALALALVVLLPVSYRSGKAAGERRIASIAWNEVNVALGEKKTVTLCDGTVLHLNSGSRLTYPAEFSGDSRVVFMDGEAFLEVAKDPGHPFVIKSQDIDVKVLGTSFNFRNYSQERHAELLLLEGSVEADVATPSDSKMLRLAPGDKMRYNRQNGNIDLDRFSPEHYKTFYQDNSLHYFDIEMADIASDLSRRFNVKIVVEDRKLASRRYFSIFTNNESLDEILTVMNSDGKMRIRRRGDIIYLHSK